MLFQEGGKLVERFDMEESDRSDPFGEFGGPKVETGGGGSSPVEWSRSSMRNRYTSVLLKFRKLLTLNAQATKVLSGDIASFCTGATVCLRIRDALVVEKVPNRDGVERGMNWHSKQSMLE
jgi:hypothetical protein